MATAPPDALAAAIEHARAARRSLTVGGRPALSDVVERTVNFKLHGWQRNHLCPMLERCRTERGLRLAIHKPPQYGGSVIISQRLPADLIGGDPGHRVGLACYNETHATGFGQVVKDLILSDSFKEVYGDLGVRKDAPAGRFFTTARQAQGDAQPSFLAMGLLSGFTGKGVDTLIIDDPYASSDDARSEAINDRVWRWWAQTAGVRISEDANVIVMFHRYHEDDFAGRLLATGKFEYVRFAAVADGGADDPTGRSVGELLSPMRSREWLQAQEDADPKTYLGQFQGKPRPDEGALCKREWFHHWPETPKLLHWVRYWDLATSTKTSGDWTVGALVGIGEGLQMYIRDIVRMRAEWPDVADVIVRTTSKDSLMCQREGASYAVGMDSRATQQGFIQDLARNACFERIPLHPDTSKGDKVERSNGWRNRGRISGIRLCGNWDQQCFIKEAMAFQGFDTDTDDQIDGVSGAYQLLWQVSNGVFEEKIDPKTIPGTWANINAITGDTEEDEW